MGLFNDFINQTRKPEGILGKMMVNGMKCYTSQAIEEALKAVGFKKTKTIHHNSTRAP